MQDEKHMDGAARRVIVSAFALGFAASGFFDGILLHQILQWHHLLSALDGNLRFQILADGWFHMAMYAVALIGAWGLWRARGALSREGMARAVGGWSLIGFGTWHAVDAVLSHWLLGIHRIRMDSDVPLAWDIGWLVLFGLIPVAIGWRMRGTGGGTGRGRAVAATLALATGLTGIGAAMPGSERPFSTVAFANGISAVEARAIVAKVDARVAWADETSGVFVLTGLGTGAALGLYGKGALFVGGSGLPEGCFGWTR